MTLDDIKWAIVATRKLKIKQEVRLSHVWFLRLLIKFLSPLPWSLGEIGWGSTSTDQTNITDYENLDVFLQTWLSRWLQGYLNSSGVLTLFRQGVPTISRAVVNIKEKDDAKGKKGDKELLVEGYGLQKVMTTKGSFKPILWLLSCWAKLQESSAYKPRRIMSSKLRKC